MTPSSNENRGAGQLRGYCAADLRLCFLDMQKASFRMTHLKYIKGGNQNAQVPAVHQRPSFYFTIFMLKLISIYDILVSKCNPRPIKKIKFGSGNPTLPNFSGET